MVAAKEERARGAIVGSGEKKGTTEKDDSA